MMWIIGILTVFLILDCLFLTLLILVQLPKKEAGMGQAFGGAATDALFGAGSGNALTKLTKYATVVFFVLTLGVSLLFAHQARSKTGTLERKMQESKETSATLPPGAIKPAATNSAVIPTNMPGNSPAPATPPATNQLITPTPAPAEKGK